MTTKRERMQQLIQKSMDMAPRTFEHEAPMARSASAANAGVEAITSIQHESHSAKRAKHTTDATIAAAGVATSPSNAQALANSPHSQIDHDSAQARSKQTWTPEEDAKLCALVQELGTTQWAVIAAHFSNRDRKRCRERFVNHLSPQLVQRTWTAREDQELVALHQRLGNHWAAIARALRGRSPEDTKNRFFAVAARDLTHESAASPTATQQPARARASRWSTAEAETLRSLVHAHGAANWFFIASQLPGRTDLQCMQQWHQVLDPAIVKGKGTWTAAEDALLAAKVAELGSKWTQVHLHIQLIDCMSGLSIAWCSLSYCIQLPVASGFEQIARALPGRMGKQCRERYLNHLDPSISSVRGALSL